VRAPAIEARVAGGTTLRGRLLPVLLALLACSFSAHAQMYDLLLKNGHVIDPANGIDGVMDVAVQGNRIVRVARAIEAADAKKTVDAAGLYVTPGFVDLHAHPYLCNSGSLFPDDSWLTTGTTTLVACGDAGWRNFDDFKKTIIDRSQARVLAFINIVGRGIAGSKAEHDTSDMDPEQTAAKIKEYPDLIVGIKTAHYSNPDWIAIDRSIAAGRLADRPIIVDSGILSNSGRDTRTKVLDKFRPGDMQTHFYNDRQIEILDRFSGKVQPYMWEARRRGVLFDMGHGAGSFLWPVAAKAMEQGYPPDTISTDLHQKSIRAGQPDMPNCISKMMLLGMPLTEAIRRSTVTPAQSIKKFPEIGTLGEGVTADIAVLKMESGIFAFKDAWGMKKMGSRRVRAVLTVRNGEIVFDEDGLGFPLWSEAGEYEKIP
jgi:dihydroorotase